MALSLDDAIGRLREKVRADAENARKDALADAARWGWRTRPSVRLEAAGEARRTPDYTTSEPLVFYALTGALAMDLPLLDGGQRRAREESALATARFWESALLDTIEAERRVVDAYAALFVARRTAEWLSATAARLEARATRLEARLEEREASLLDATWAREAALSVRIEETGAQEEAVEAEGRLRMLLGLWDEGRLDVDLAAVLEALPVAAAGPPPSGTGDVARELLAAEKLRRSAEEAAAKGRFRLDLSAFAGLAVARSEFLGRTTTGTGFGTYGGRLLATLPLLERSASLERERLRVQAELADARAREAGRARQEERRRQGLALEELDRKVELARTRLRLSLEREASVSRLVEAGLARETSLATAEADTARRRCELLRTQAVRYARGWRRTPPS